MKTRPILVLGLSLFLSLASGKTGAAESWPAWRGDGEGSGRAVNADIPVQWSKDKNVRWRIELPERGNSTPVIWGDRIFVTQAIEKDKWRGLMCFSRADGKLLWKSGLTYDKPERTHRTNPYCSASPATDGKLVFVSYGSAGVACYDFQGTEQWRRDFGAIDHVWGNSASPVLHGDLSIHYHGPGPGGFLIALNKKTGETVWKFDEPAWKPGERTDGFKGDPDGVIGSFSTPILVDTGGAGGTGKRTELIMSFPMDIRAFDPASGKELWRCGGLNPLVYTSPAYGDGIIVALGGYYGNTVAVKVGGEGDVTQTHRLWQHVRDNGGIGSGVIKGGHLYYHDSGGVALCVEIKTGETLWKSRLPGISKSWGSYMLAGDRIYALSQAGETAVFKANPEELEVIAHNHLGEVTNSSIAPAGKELFIRTHEALWCIGDAATK
ncbi:MAG: PQQ-binding-like beta-propeller repeat protein [Phycisphaeraceae bacterium]